MSPSYSKPSNHNEVRQIVWRTARLFRAQLRRATVDFLIFDLDCRVFCSRIDQYPGIYAVCISEVRCGRISMESEAEEITVCSGTTSPKRHGKRSNPYSTSGVDKFQSVYAEFSAKKEYIANKIGEPEATVTFVSSKKRWIPVVIGARDQETGKKNSGAGAAGVSIVGPVEKSNSVDHDCKHLS